MRPCAATRLYIRLWVFYDDHITMIILQGILHNIMIRILQNILQKAACCCAQQHAVIYKAVGVFYNTHIMNIMCLSVCVCVCVCICICICIHTHTHTHTHIIQGRKRKRKLCVPISSLRRFFFLKKIYYTGPQAPKKAVCVITGQPAKYRDPKTGQPYATIEAFRKIREKDEKGK